jgi:molecular chaperone DnaK (HSP70)
LPTIISIKSKDIFEIGKPSPKMEAKQPENIVTEIKRLIGIRFDDPRIQKDKEHWTFKVDQYLKIITRMNNAKLGCWQ